MKTRPTELTKPCCEVLEKLEIGWMNTEEGTRLMPYIEGDDGNMYRVNFCPSCGTEIRHITLKYSSDEKPV